MSATARLYAMTRLRAGDYLCPSNDGEWLWRFQSYEDGRAMGLDVAYDARTFWMAKRAPMPAGGALHPDDVDDLRWTEVAARLPSRRAAIEEMLNAPVLPTCAIRSAEAVTE